MIERISAPAAAHFGRVPVPGCRCNLCLEADSEGLSFPILPTSNLAGPARRLIERQVAKHEAQFGPARVQRRRTRGYRLPEGAVYVGRPTKWGNPFRPAAGQYLGTDYCVDIDWRLAVELYRGWVLARVRCGQLDLEELRGKVLACYCPLDRPCHADVLRELANAPRIAA